MQKALTDDGRQLVGKKPTLVWGRVFNIIVVTADVVVVVIINITVFESHFLRGKSQIKILGRLLFK